MISKKCRTSTKRGLGSKSRQRAWAHRIARARLEVFAVQPPRHSPSLAAQLVPDKVGACNGLRQRCCEWRLQQSLIEHWTGMTWAVVQSPDVGGGSTTHDLRR